MWLNKVTGFCAHLREEVSVTITIAHELHSLFVV